MCCLFFFFFFSLSMLELWQHVTILNSKHGILNIGSFILSPPLIMPMRKAEQSWWVAGEAARSSLPSSPASSHKPNHTCSPTCMSQRDPHCCLSCTCSVHEADILAEGGVIPTPALTCFCYAHAHFAHAIRPSHCPHWTNTILQLPSSSTVEVFVAYFYLFRVADR